MPRGVISNQDIRNLFINIHTAIAMLGRRNPDNIEEIIAHTIDGVGESEEIPFSMNQVKVGKLNPDQERNFVGTQANKFVIKHDLYGPEAGFHILWDTLMSDARMFRLLETKGEQMLTQSTLVWRTMLALLMARPGNSYDGVGFWSAQHLIDPLKPNVAANQQSNVLVNANPDKAGILRAITMLVLMKGHNGELLSTPTDIRIIAPTPDIETSAKEVVNSSVIPVPVGVGAAVTVANQLVGIARVHRFPELAAYSSKQFYVLDVSDPIERAFFLSKVRNATFFYDGLNPNDESRKKRYRVEMGWDAYGGPGLGQHQKAIQVTLPGGP